MKHETRKKLQDASRTDRASRILELETRKHNPHASRKVGGMKTLEPDQKVEYELEDGKDGKVSAGNLKAI